MTPSPRGLAALGTLLALLAPGALGHGWLAVPESRNSLRNTDNSLPAAIAYTRQSGNGFAPALGGTVGNPGVCGDPWQDLTDARYANYFGALAWGAAFAGTGKAAPVYQAGQRVTLTWQITAVHGGFISFKLCPRSSSLDQACFNANVLQRADGAGPQVWHTTTSAAGIYSAEFVLPAGVSCPNGCVLQWEYYTGNSCVPPCLNRDLAACAPYDKRGILPNCGAPGASAGERFHNCADIIIQGGTTPPPQCPPSCPVANACQTGGGCNTATGTCVPLVSKADGTACQSGVCRSGACVTSSPAPSPSPSPAPRCSVTASPGGACGASAGGACCPSGQCCSQFGWCGIQSGHCGTGCQSLFGACTTGTATTRAMRIQARGAALAAAAPNATEAAAVNAEPAVVGDPAAATPVVDPAAAAAAGP